MMAPLSTARFHRLMALAVWRQAVNRARQAVHQSRLMVSVIALFVAGYWAGFTWLFYDGLRFMRFGVPALGDLLVARMLYILFAFVFLMLGMSTAVAAYTVFFRNRETIWLQTLPVPRGALFQWKFAETAMLASWAFLFLSGPLLLAYGLLLRLPVWFLPSVFAIYLPFSLLANALGTALLFLVIWLWHERWGRGVIFFVMVFLLLGAGVWYRPIDVNALREAEIVPLMNLLLRNTRMAVTPLLPSYWLTSAVIGLGERGWLKPLFFFALTAGYAALACRLALRHLPPLFVENASRVQDRRLHGRPPADRTSLGLLCLTGRALSGWMIWLPRPVRAILWKDWVVFWRDATQWSQFAIFFGLLGFYFLNIRNLHYQLDDRFWISVVAFLNMASMGLILATLTTRFVFPQFSLEGRRLWLVGLAPVRLRQIVWGKFWASTLLAGGLTLVLMTFSFSSLQLDPPLRWLIGTTVVLMSFGLSGIAVGMGVLFPNFRQSSAAQVVSGFGGTLCLILSLAYVALVVALVALPMHLRFMARLPLDFDFTSPVGVIYTGALVLSLVAALAPMRLANRSLERLEF